VPEEDKNQIVRLDEVLVNTKSRLNIIVFKFEWIYEKHDKMVGEPVEWSDF